MSKKVLLIEDDIGIQRVYSEGLKLGGFDVVMSIDSGSGLQLAKVEKPDIILLDIMLPGKMNGFDVLEYLKKNSELKNIPIIIITNLDTEKEQALKIGADDYLVKVDTTPDDLVLRIKKLIG